MITLESVIQEWKTKCGIDDFGKNQDILIEIIKQHHLTIQQLTQKQYSSYEEEYEDLIKETLGTSTIPIPTTNIQSLSDLLNVQLTDEDKIIFSTLYSIKPTTKSGNKNSSIIGKGEIAIYWLFKYNPIQYITKKGTKGADFNINGTGIEIKSFEDKYINIGRFQSSQYFQDLLEILNIAYSLSTISEFTTSKKQIKHSTLSITPSQLDKVFDEIKTMSDNIKKGNGGIYDQNIHNAILRLEEIYNNRNNTKNQPLPSNVELSKFFISELVKTKLKLTPGIGGYILNIQNTNEIKGVNITQELLNSNIFIDNCYKYASAIGGSIRINFEEIFDIK